MLDGYAVTSDLKEPNPLMSHSYINFEGNGLWNINPGTNISNRFNPNHSFKKQHLNLVKICNVMVDYSKAKFYRILNDKMTMSILALLVSH